MVLQTLALLLLATLMRPAQAQGRYYIPEVPADLSQVDFYLLTAGLGPQLHERFGHTGIRIHDRTNDRDVVFNWGKFSFNEPAFALKFYRGSLVYSMGVRTMASEIDSFQTAGRRLVQERIQLSASQKRTLFNKIAWNAIPDNRNFAYQYWYKNCATIPRDYLDQALHGQIQARFTGINAGVVFRDYVRSNLQAIPFVVPGLDIVMNGNIDRPISKWDEMFLPRKLRETLLEMPQISDQGDALAGTRLLEDTVVLVDQLEDDAQSIPDYPILAFLGLAPLLVAALASLRQNRQRAYRALGLAGMVWGALSGFVGVALVVNWLLSGHPDTWHNVNLMIFFPFDWLLVGIGWGLWRAGDRIKDRLLILHSGRALVVLHLVTLILLVVGTAAGLIEQNIWRVVAWFGVPTVLLAMAYATWAFGSPVLIPAAAPIKQRTRKPAVARSR